MSKQTKFKKHKKAHYFNNYNNLKELVKMLNLRSNDDMDNVVMITAYNGMGKSTLREIMNHLLDPYYNIWKQCFLKENGRVFAEKLIQLREERKDIDAYMSIGLDEMKNQFDGQESYMSKNVRIGTNEMTENRKHNATIIGTTPFQDKISPYMRNDRVKFWIFILKKGKTGIRPAVAILLKNLHTPLGGNWHLDILEKTIDKAMKKGRPPTLNEYLKAFKKMPNTWKEKGRLKLIKFPALPDEMFDEYNKWVAFKETEKFGEKPIKESSLAIKRGTWLKNVIRMYRLTPKQLEKSGMKKRTATEYGWKEAKAYTEQNKSNQDVKNLKLKQLKDSLIIP